MKRKRKKIELEYIDWFDARGLKRLYGADHWQFAGKRKYSIDIWSGKDGRLLMRFHSGGKEEDSYAYEIKGIEYTDIPKEEIGTEAWIPNVVFQEFEDWMFSEMPSATSMKEYMELIKKAAAVYKGDKNKTS